MSGFPCFYRVGKGFQLKGGRDRLFASFCRKREGRGHYAASRKEKEKREEPRGGERDLLLLHPKKGEEKGRSDSPLCSSTGRGRSNHRKKRKNPTPR